MTQTRRIGQILCFLLSLLCITRAFSKFDNVFHPLKESYLNSIFKLTRSLDPFDPERYFVEAFDNKADQPKKAYAAIEKYLARRDFDSRAWRLKAEIASKLGDHESALRAHDESIKNDPNNGRRLYEAGVGVLTLKDEVLTHNAKLMALMWLRRSLSVRQYASFSPYLEKMPEYTQSLFSFLWERFGKVDVLIEVTPVDIFSYKALLDFLDSKALWSERNKVFDPLLIMRAEFYNAHVNLGLGYLKEKKYDMAFFAFRKAYWMREWAYPEAKLGILVAQASLGDLPKGNEGLFEEPLGVTLEKIFQDEDASLDRILAYGGSLFKDEPNKILLEKYRLKRVGESANYERVPSELQAKKNEILAVNWLDKDQSAYAQKVLFLAGTCRVQIPIDIRDAEVYFVVKINEKIQKGFYFSGKGLRMLDFIFSSTGGDRWVTLEKLYQTGSVVLKDGSFRFVK